jgi:hypothetical protein
MILKKGFFFSLLMFLFLGCADSQGIPDSQPKCRPKEYGDYIVHVQIDGEASSFEGRRIEINGVQLKERDACIARDSNGCSQYRAEPEYVLGFCTESEETFLQKPLDIVVYEGSSLISKLSYERTTCLNSAEEDLFKVQYNYLLLTPEGKIEEDNHICDRNCGMGTVTCAEAREHLSPL